LWLEKFGERTDFPNEVVFRSLVVYSKIPYNEPENEPQDVVASIEHPVSSGEADQEPSEGKNAEQGGSKAA